MTTPKIYGIKNCDTMKKAFRWLEENGISYDFHDYKKSGAAEDILKDAIEKHGWEKVINRRGTTWRKLPDNVKDTMDAQSAVIYAQDNPSLIKRPVLVHGKDILLGFDDKVYKDTFG